MKKSISFIFSVGLAAFACGIVSASGNEPDYFVQWAGITTYNQPGPYINTGYVFTKMPLIEAGVAGLKCGDNDVMGMSAAGNGSMVVNLCNDGGTGYQFYRYGSSSTGCTYHTNSIPSLNTTTFNDVVWSRVVSYNGEEILTSNYGKTDSVFSGNTLPFYFFKARNSFAGTMKLSYLRMYNGTNRAELVRSYRPGVKNGVVGFYDSVEDKFYTNAGSGSFSCSPGGLKQAVWVRAEPAKFGSPVPSYGCYEFALNEQRSFDANGELAFLNDAETIRGRVTQYRVDTWDPAGEDWLLGDVVAGTNYVHTQSDDGSRRLTWHWDVAYKTTLAKTTGGDVSVSEGWTSHGDTFTATATPAPGYVFYCWTGDIDRVEDMNSAALSITNMAAPVALTAQFREEDLINPDTAGGDDYAKIAAAIDDAGEGGTVRLGPGTFHISQSLELKSAITIVGSGMDVTFVKPTTTGFRGFYLQNKDVEVSDLTVDGFTGARGRYYYGPGVCMTAGTLRRCRVSNNHRNDYYDHGGGVYANGSQCKVIGCVINGNVYNRQVGAGYYGGGMYLKGGAVADGCLIMNNEVDFQSGTLTAGNVYLNDGRLYNSTVVKNYHGTGIIMNSTSDVVSNCVSALNTDCYAKGPSPSDLGVSNWSSTNKIYNTLVGDAADFVDAANGDYRLRGMARTKDVGYWRFDPTADYLDFAADAPAVFQTSNITLRAALYGKYAGATPSWKVTDGDGNEYAVSGTNPATLTLANVGKYTVELTAGGEKVTREDYLVVRAPVLDVPVGTDTLYDALQGAIDGETLKLAEGTYYTTKQLVVDRAITIEGVSYTNTTVARPESASKFGIFVLTHSKALLKGMTITNGRAGDFYYVEGSGVRICGNGGTVDHCRMTGNHDWAYYTDGLGVGLMSANAYVTHCIIDNNTGSNREGGGGVRMSAGILDNCLVINNKAGSGAGVYMTGGTVRNCTIAKNTASSSGGGLHYNGWTPNIKVYNTIIAGNTAENDTFTEGRPQWCRSNVQSTSTFSNCFQNCAFEDCGVLGSGSIAVSVPFMNQEGGDFTLKASCKAINGGFEYDGLSDTDLVDFDRISGDAPDIGCYEFDLSQVSCDFTVSPLVIWVNDSVTLTPTVNGAEGKTLKYRWELTDDNGNVTVSTLENPTISIPTGGTYKVSLAIYDNNDKKLAEQSHASSFRVVVKTVYVKETNPHMRAPYDTWDTAHTNLNEVMDLLADGCTVLLDEGTFVITNQLEILKSLTFTGKGMDKTIVKFVKSSNGSNHRVFRINHPDSVVERMTITGGVNQYAYDSYGMGVYIDVQGGTLRDCRVTGNKSSTYYVRGAVGVVSSKGRVERCIINNNQNLYGQSSSYAGLAMSAGIAVNCLVYSNKSFTAAGLYVLDGPIVSNCTFTCNEATLSGAGGCTTGYYCYMKFYNCIFAGNKGIDSQGTYTATLDANEFTYSWGVGQRPQVDGYLASNPHNCCFKFVEGVTATIGVNGVYADPGFVNPLNDFHLRASQGPDCSPCVNAGAYDPGMLGMTDLDGKPRVKHVKRTGKGMVDIGCYESTYHPKPFMLLVK